MDRVTRYKLAKRRMADVVRSLSDDELGAVCPACPAWSIRDVVAHHVHAAGVYTDGNAPLENLIGFMEPDAAKRAAAGVIRDDWTESGVLERRGVPMGDLLDEWKGVVRRMDTGDDVSLFDLVVHLGDVVEALGDRGAIDTDLAEVALRTCYEFALTRRLAAIGESMVLVCSDTGLRVGASPGAAVVRGSLYELHRTLAGRRTRAEADAALDWGTAPGRRPRTVRHLPLGDRIDGHLTESDSGSDDRRHQATEAGSPTTPPKRAVTCPAERCASGSPVVAPRGKG